jgi:hypothetical protein
MNTHKQTLYQAFLGRISRGAVPMDGIYWIDPKDAGKADAGIADAGKVDARKADAGTSKSPRRSSVPGQDWPPASLSWFLPRS